MAVNVVYGDTADVNALIYQLPHQNTVNFIQQRMQDASQRIVGAGQQFFNQARDLYDRFAGEAAIRKAKAAKRAMGSLWDDNEVRTLSNVEELQAANNVMRRWVMANPMIRDMYKKQQIEGYDTLYKDPFPDEASGEDNYDYRRVMNGIVEEFVDTDGEDNWRATTWIEDLLPEDHELDFLDQNEVLCTWEALENIVRRRKDDPTSRFNAELG